MHQKTVKIISRFVCFLNGRGLRILLIKILGIINFGDQIIMKSACKTFLNYLPQLNSILQHSNHNDTKHINKYTI